MEYRYVLRCPWCQHQLTAPRIVTDRATPPALSVSGLCQDCVRDALAHMALIGQGHWGATLRSHAYPGHAARMRAHCRRVGAWLRRRKRAS